MNARPDNRPDVSPEERATCALIKRIQKLRWIGMEAEAERLLSFERNGTPPLKRPPTVLADLHDTD